MCGISFPLQYAISPPLSCLKGDPSVNEAHIDDVLEDQVPILLSPNVVVDDAIDEIDVMEFLRDPRREGEGVVIGDTNEMDPLFSRSYDCTLSMT